MGKMIVVLGLAMALLLGGCAPDGVEIAVYEAGDMARQPTLVCGGFAGFPCDDGWVCIDDPRDACDPDKGGADCIGVCRPEQSQNPPGRECTDTPTKTYVGTTEECALIRFLCADGWTYFADDCGCGCETLP
jgi:hypothetical protein